MKILIMALRPICYYFVVFECRCPSVTSLERILQSSRLCPNLLPRSFLDDFLAIRLTPSCRATPS
jgi:hypothetical protein